MAKEGDYVINDIYQGGPSSLNPNFIEGMEGGKMGLTTDPRTGNILQEVSTKLSTGVKSIEVELVSPDMLDQIPKQQFEEVRRQAKLVGADVSVHGPVIDTTGINQQGFSELNREASERKIIETIKRSHELDPKGNVLVNLHSAEGIPGTEWKRIGDEAKGIKPEAKRLIVVNKESGKLAPLEEEKRHLPRMTIKTLKDGEESDPYDELKNLNETEWVNAISGAVFNKESADRIMSEIPPIAKKVYFELKTGQIKSTDLNQSEMDVLTRIDNASDYLDQSKKVADSLFNRAYKYGTFEQKKQLEDASNTYKKTMGINNNGEYSREEIIKINDPITQSRALQKLLGKLKFIAPEMYVPVEEFAVEQSSKTFGNAAFEGWKKYKDNTPIVNIENPPVGFALSTGEDLRNLVEGSRKHFVKKAKEDGLSEKEAKKEAEKIIGATWDVGHINMLRKQGFEEKDIIEETKKIAPYVKHVHLSDNFGLEHTELPMGMGNVPIKEIMDKLGKKGFESKKIIEAAHWWQHFKTSPVQPTLELMGSPIYTEGVGPYWNQAIGLQQGYYSGMGAIFPNVNYQTFGAGFSQLPSELGGQMPGAQGGRMSGKPME